MDKFPNIPEYEGSMNQYLVLPSIKTIIGSNSFPAYMRLAAMEMHDQGYCTVGSILTSMNIEDLSAASTVWHKQVETARAEAAEGAESSVMRISSPAVFSYMLFAGLLVRAEEGEVGFNPVTIGVQAELLSSFMQVLLIQDQFEQVKVDPTKFTLSMDFFRQDFDHVLSTDNFKAIKFVKEVTGNWNKMKKSSLIQSMMTGKEPKKDELIAAPSFVSRMKSKTTSMKDLFKAPDLDIDLTMPGPGSTKSSAPSAGMEDQSLSSIEAELKKLLGGE